MRVVIWKLHANWFSFGCFGCIAEATLTFTESLFTVVSIFHIVLSFEVSLGSRGTATFVINLISQMLHFTLFSVPSLIKYFYTSLFEKEAMVSIS